MRYRFLVPLLAGFLPGAAVADICKYVDQDGRVTFSNVPIKNATKVTCFEPLSPVPSAKQKRSNQGPADFPKVDAGTQRLRDDARRKILLDELAHEEARLGEVRRALDEGRRLADQRAAAVRAQAPARDPGQEIRIKSLQDDVALHERNVEALKKELGNLK